MATNTYVELLTHTIPSSVASYTFTSIPQGYTDLVVVCNFFTSAAQSVEARVGNGSIDIGNNYSNTAMIARTTNSVTSTRRSNFSYFTFFEQSGASSGTWIMNFQNYSNTTTFKTMLGRNGGAAFDVEASAQLWRSTSAINILQLFAGQGGITFSAGTTFSLYGIAKASSGAKATGGVILSDDNYWYHTFYNSGTFTPSQAISAQILAVGGGGGGGGNIGAGGGAGAMTTFSTTSSLSSGVTYTCTVGSGGAGATSSTNGSNGGPTSFAGSGFSTITALGGGYGAQSSAGGAGGSGGGAGPSQPPPAGGTASGPNTNIGGTGTYSYPYYGAGGGGGATAPGSNGTASGAAIGGNGGQGYTISTIDSALPATKIFGSMTVIASGGGGSGVRPDGGGGSTRGTGGTGAGNGGTQSTNPTNPTSYGSGGGGGTWENFGGGAATNGYQGIIVVRYAKA